jgi:hypothetical protein
MPFEPGGVSVQDLKEKDLDRDDRVKRRFDPRHPAITTNVSDILDVKFFGPILLELSNHIRDTAHWWRLLFACGNGNHFSIRRRRRLISRQQCYDSNA